MKGLLCFIILTATACGSAFAEEYLTNYSVVQKIETTGNAKYVQLPLSREVYRYTLSDLRDLRVADSKGTLVPYYIDHPIMLEKLETREGETRRISAVLKKHSIFDFQVIQAPQDFGANELKVVTETAEYSKQVEVYGRNTDSKWEFITIDSIYRIGGSVKESIHLQKNCPYRFFRIIVLDNREKLAITECLLLEKVKYGIRNINMQDEPMAYQSTNIGKKTILTIKNPFRMKLAKLNFELKGNFYRDYELYRIGVDGATQELLEGSLYRMEFNKTLLSNTSLNIDEPIYTTGDLKLVINNQDNQPLTIGKISASAVYDTLIFEKTGEQPYSLYFGCPDAERPVFDLENFKEYIKSERKDMGNLKALKVRTDNALKKQAPDLKLIFNLIIGAVSLCLTAFLILKLVRTK